MYFLCLLISGLDPDQKKKILYWPRLLYREFPFDKYPAHFNVHIKAGKINADLLY